VSLLRDDITAQLKREFASLSNPVRLLVFSQALADPESEQVKRLVEELAALDSRLSAESYNYILDRDKAETLKIARTPAIAILSGEKDYGIRFYGLPVAHEFGTLVDAILDVSQGESGLAEETRTALEGLTGNVHIQVFSTPT
jgi:alkyl hydroperoxide reductase subunit AhpF